MPPPSLRLLLLQRLLPAMLALLLAGSATAYWVAWRSATKAYDRALFDTTLAVADQLRIIDGKPQLPLTPQARAVLLTDKFDQIFYAVRGPDGGLLDGEAELPTLAPVSPEAAGSEGRFYFDGWLHGQPIRVAALERKLGNLVITVLAGETMVKRNALVREILLGMLLPELVLALVSLAVVWYGVRAGLAPLSVLRRELAGRSQNDLRPVEVEVPEEIGPVVREINELLHRLEHSLNSQRNFVSGAAHQLRTPIAALQAQIEATARESGSATEPKLDGVLSATKRLSHLVDQMLLLARADPSSGHGLSKVSLESVTRKVAENCLPIAFERRIDLGFELSPSSVLGNPVLLEELLGNLLNNALRHTPEGGMITVSCGNQAQIAWLAVEDSGPGIANTERERVFERFYQPIDSLSDGNGLGLSIVREIARQHGGSVEAKTSKRLGGASLLVRFPAA